ncbi:sulfatase [Halorubellus salinus]|uniref:sulfatase n=1 Tax=Halorubellus salinus TaxID=755309 RepID=UPI001D0939C0|nr:sulfatase [Halorubellus salinus]
MVDSSSNVLYITIDSLRADRVGFVGEESDTTPVLDGVANDGMSFEYAIANGIPTYYSFKSLLGGIQSLSHDRDIGLPDTATSIAEVFREQGYTTAGFNAKNPWLTENYGYDRGFDEYRDFMSDDKTRFNTGGISRRLKRLAKRSVAFSDTLTDTLGRFGRMANAAVGSQPLTPAEPLTEAAIDWLEERDDERPFFLWIHYMDPHYPWIPPEDYLPEDSDVKLSRLEIGRIWHTVAHEYKKEHADIDSDIVAQIQQLYEAEIRRTDAAIGKLLSALKQQHEFEETTVAVAGDHGTELHDHGGFSHGPDTLYQEIIHVPLLFRGPGIPSSNRDVAALVDIPRTIVEATVGDEALPETFEGINLLSEERVGVSTEVVYKFDPARGENSENGVLQARTEPPWKLIRNQHTESLEFYNIEDDSDECALIQNEQERRKTLESKLNDFREFIEQRNRTVAEKQRVRERIAELREEGEI